MPRMSRTTRMVLMSAIAPLGLASIAQAGTYITVATTNTPMPGYGARILAPLIPATPPLLPMGPTSSFTALTEAPKKASTTTT